jgi:CheY-like chemotaxis protein
MRAIGPKPVAHGPAVRQWARRKERTVGIPAAGGRKGRLKVLVVDDDSLFCQVMEVILGLKRYVGEVRTAGCAAEALEVFEEFEPDVVFVDHVMPSVAGDELGSHLRSLHPWLRLLSISALYGREKPSWADEHFTKNGDLFRNLERRLRGIALA